MPKVLLASKKDSRLEKKDCADEKKAVAGGGTVRSGKVETASRGGEKNGEREQEELRKGSAACIPWKRSSRTSTVNRAPKRREFQRGGTIGNLGPRAESRK